MVYTITVNSLQRCSNKNDLKITVHRLERVDVHVGEFVVDEFKCERINRHSNTPSHDRFQEGTRVNSADHNKCKFYHHR